MVFTMPGAFHIGLNTGANVSVATNFSMPRWLGTKSLVSICKCTTGLELLRDVYVNHILLALRDQDRHDGLLIFLFNAEYLVSYSYPTHLQPSAHAWSGIPVRTRL